MEVRWDPMLSTIRDDIHARKPDLLIVNHTKRTIAIVEVTCCMDTRLDEAFREKYDKYVVLKTDLGNQYPGYKVTISPLVMGDSWSLRQAALSDSH